MLAQYTLGNLFIVYSLIAVTKLLFWVYEPQEPVAPFTIDRRKV